MKKIVLNILLLCLIFSLTSCNKKEPTVIGLYQWSQQNDDLNLEYLKSIKISENSDGDLELVLKDKYRNASGDAIYNNLDTTIIVDSRIKLGKVTTAYSDTEFNYCKHEFIFEKNSVKWRYCVIKSYLPDVDIVTDDIESIEYCKLKKYNSK